MDYLRIGSPADLQPHMGTLLAATAIAVDLETTGLDAHLHRIRLIQLAVDGTPPLVIDADAFLPKGLDMLRQALSTDAVKVLQNAKFDLQFLLPLGIAPKPIFDTMLAGRLLYMPGVPRRVNLQTLAEYYLGEALDKTEQKGGWDGALTESQLAYAAKDADILLRLRHAMRPRLRDAGLGQVAAIEFGCVRAIAQMEYRGIALDVPAWRQLADQTEAERDAAQIALRSHAGEQLAQTTLWGGEEYLGINLDSNADMLALLHANGVPVQATAKGDLYPYRDRPIVRDLTAYRKAAKALSSILLPTLHLVHPADGRLHPQYGQIGAYSGRMSCGNPNIQQIPRAQAFRACFAAPNGRCLVLADYAQIELRVAAQFAGEARMLAAYRAGEDLHTLTASLLVGKPMEAVTKQQRQAAKAVNFGLIYGMGAAGLQQYAGQSYGVAMSLEEATRFRRRFFEAYPGIAAWHQRIQAGPGGEGRTLTGRRFPISENPTLPELSNTPVQGTAADICKLALSMLVDRLPEDTWIVATVHDEILLECPAQEADAVVAVLRGAMEDASLAILPAIPPAVDAHAATSWAEK